MLLSSIKISISDEAIFIKFNSMVDLIDVLCILKSVGDDENVIISRVLLCDNSLGLKRKNDITHYLNKSYMELDYFLKSRTQNPERGASSHIMAASKIIDSEIVIYTLAKPQYLPKIKDRETIIQEIIEDFKNKTKKN